MKSVTTWILIADGARARVLENTGPNKGLSAKEGLLFEGEHRPPRDAEFDKPGRTFESVGALRHAKQPRTDPHDKLKSEFVSSVAAALEENSDHFDRLVLVAPPATLGELRTALPRQVADKVTKEVGKDLTHTPNAEIGTHLASVIAL